MSSQYAAPAPLHPNYHSNIQAWSTSSTPPPRASSSRTTRRATRSSNLAQSSQTHYQPYNANYYQQPQPQYFPQGQGRTNPPRAVLPSATQALHSTYASRLRTGTTLLMQPILANTTTAVTTGGAGGGAVGVGGGGGGGGGGAGGLRSRRTTVINYAEPGSGDEMLDAGAIDSDDSDFIASGGTRTSVRKTVGPRSGGLTANVYQLGREGPSPQPAQTRNELDQSYLGMVPPSRFITAKGVLPTRHEYFTQEQLEREAQKPIGLVPIRVEFETDTHRIRDGFVWNLHENLITPESFARIFCTDLDLPQHPWAETVANQIRAQLEEHEGVASIDLSGIGEIGMEPVDSDREDNGAGLEMIPDCRVILSLDVQIATHHLLDHIEWDLLSTLTPESFAAKLCSELGLSGEAHPLISHAVHEELVKHKKDAIEWGVIGGDRDLHHYHVDDGSKDRSSLSLVKDKTGLGLGWGRTPKDGRGPKVLKSIWRDWAEAEEFRTKFEVLTAEEVERRENERERATRRLRRETSKFQHQSTRRRR